MSIYKYVNTTSYTITTASFSIASTDFIQISTRHSELEPYVNNGLELYKDSVKQDNYVSATLDNTSLTNKDNPGIVVGGTQVVISGNPVPRGVLTATPGTGWSFTAGQWYKNGSAISGATGLTYTLVDADASADISFTPTSPVFKNSIKTRATVPGAPTIGTASASSSTISVTFTAPTSTGGSAITGYKATLSDGSIGIGSSSPINIVGVENGVAKTAIVQALNAIGYGQPSASSNSVTPTDLVPIVVLTQNQSPYTIQASDSGKILAPATTAEFIINVPTSLGATFTCSIAPTGNYPTQIAESGASVSNSGYRISNANNMANSVILPGATATLTAASANVLNLTGNLSFYQQVIDGTGLNDSNTGAYAQVTGFMKCRAKGAPGTYLIGLKFLYGHRFSNIETVPAYSADVGFSIEYPIGSTPQLAKFGGVDQVTVTGNETEGGVISDFLLLNTPIPLSMTGTEVGIHAGQSTGNGANPCLTGKGSGRALTGEVFLGGAGAGTQWKTNLSVVGSSITDGAQNKTSLSSPAMFRPSAIIGVTNTGATVLIGDSRMQPSNGDRQVVSSGYKGQGERILGDENVTLNLAISASQLTFFNNTTQGKWRQYLARYGRKLFINGFYNDANKSLVSIRGLIPTLRSQSSCVGKPVTLRSTDPGTTSTDKWSSRAGQAAINLTNSQNIDTINAEGAAKTLSGVDFFVDARSYVEDPVALADGTKGYRSAVGARTVTDGSMTTGSDVFSSTTANFTSGDTGSYIYIPGLTVSGTQVQACIMTYVNSTSVTLKSVQSELQVVAQADLTGLTCYIRCLESTFDGIHQSIRQGVYEQTSRASIPVL